MLLRRFMITLLFSWIANPLGVLVAQWLGVTQDPILVIVLLAMGACVPFQIFLNEAIAVRAAAGHDPGRDGRLLLTLIVAMQATTCAVALLALPSTPISWAMLAVVVVATAFTSVASYLCTKRYYELSVAGAVSSRQAAAFGAIPGVVALLVYLAASVLAGYSVIGLHVALVLVAVLPTTVVWLFISSIRHGSTASSGPPASLPSLRQVALVLLGLVVLTIAGTRLRADIAALRSDYAAVIVVVLNSLASLLTTLTRAMFLRQKQRLHVALLPGLAVLAAAVGFFLHAAHPVTSQILWLLGVQGLVISLIEVGRRAGLSRQAMPAPAH
jgi:hypothetical protein